MTRNLCLTLACVALVTGTACADDETEFTDAELVAMQIADGAALYTSNCAGCHGGSGEGTDMGPAVVGNGVFPKDPPAGAVRDVQFVTALDIFVWAQANMPPNAPGTVPAEDMLKVFAFALDANGVKLETPLDADVAKAIVINP